MATPSGAPLRPDALHISAAARAIRFVSSVGHAGSSQVSSNGPRTWRSVSVSCSAIDWKIVRSSWYPSARVATTRSERLIFANARTRMAELIKRDRFGGPWNVDLEYLVSERHVRLDLRQGE